MLRDASHQQVIQKFSFIESLNLSRKITPADKENLEQIDRDKPNNLAESEGLASPPQSTWDSVPQKATISSAIVNTSDRSATIDTNWYQSNSDNYNLSLAEIVKNSDTEKSSNYQKSKPKNYLGKILFALVSSYCIFALWWLFGDRASSILTTLMGGKQITISKSDVEFIEYMEQSVSAIESKLQTEKDADRDREVVYVPVYTPNSTPPALGQVSNNNAPTTPTAIAQPRPNLATEALKIPAPPPLPAPTSLSTESTAAPTKLAAIKTQPAIKHTLTGILELGENRTAALIKVNGQTRRFWLGEKIGNSEWILESVSHNSARISDSEQTRSIAVGETF